MNKALTIAGSDSSGGAGIQADLKTFAAHEVYDTSVVTAVTAQNTHGVQSVHILPASVVAAQIDAVLADIKPDAIKTGMLANAEIVRVVADRVRGWPLVVDPIIMSTSGHQLLSLDALSVLLDELVPLATVITPNLDEANALLGAEHTADAAAVALARLGPELVVVTGGDRDAVDVCYFEGNVHRLEEGKIDTPHTHGTGCTFSAAIAAELARGTPPLAAARSAKRYVTEGLRQAVSVGEGRSGVCHFQKAPR